LLCAVLSKRRSVTDIREETVIVSEIDPKREKKSTKTDNNNDENSEDDDNDNNKNR
jgi:hypothetical protein